MGAEARLEEFFQGYAHIKAVLHKKIADLEKKIADLEAAREAASADSN